MTTRNELFALRADLEAEALALMVRKNADYASAENALLNYERAAEKANTAPSLFILGRYEEKLTRLSNIIRVGEAAVSDEPVRRELVDCSNFPSLILAALKRSPIPPKF